MFSKATPLILRKLLYLINTDKIWDD